MPTFFLHIHEHGCLIEDPEGVDLINIDAAVVEAISGMRSIIAQKFMNEELVTLRAIEISNLDGQVLRTVPLREALADVLPHEALSERRKCVWFREVKASINI